MSVASATANALPVARRSSRRALTLVILCTLINAGAQMLIKNGASHLTQPGVFHTALGLITDPLLFTGYSLYGVSAVLLVLALRDAELSLLYPVIALTYVWVCLLSVFVLHETMNAFKIAGIAVIVLGVAILGRQRK